jgi:NADPH-dependent 2,4-dienoyl-CoA reductase/sulfur reductase-like enzyme
VERFTSLGVDCVAGHARIVSPWEVEVNGERMRTRHIVIASGARARVPDIPGLEHLDYLTSDTLWDIRELPRRCWWSAPVPSAASWPRRWLLGFRRDPRDPRAARLPREDADASALVHAAFKPAVHRFRTGCEPLPLPATARGRGALPRWGRRGDAALRPRAPRRGPHAEHRGPGPRGARHRTTARGTIEVDEYLQTAVPTIYACGDIVGPYQFTHVASHQAWYATVNALFGHLRRFRVDYSVIPWATFTSPEVARVGLSRRRGGGARACPTR